MRVFKIKYAMLLPRRTGGARWENLEQVYVTESPCAYKMIGKVFENMDNVRITSCELISDSAAIVEKHEQYPCGMETK